MSQEIVEAVRALAREKGISEEKLITALEDALLSAYKKQPGAVRYARVHLDPDLGEYRVEELILPVDLEDQLLDEAEELATGELERRVDPETGEVIIPEAPEIAQSRAGRVRGPDREARRHARRLRPDRRADRQAGHPAADPRGRARHDVRGVPGPRRRADHRHRPAVGLPLHARAAARARRGAAAEVRAGRRRALRPLPARQGGHQGGLLLDPRAEHHRQPPRPGADQEAVRARGARDRRRPGGDHQRRARARLPLEDRGRLARRRRRPGRRLRRSTRLARAHGRLRAARREDRHHPLQRRARPVRRQGAESRARARGARRRREPPGHRDRARTTSSRWRSAARARTRGSPPASPAGASTSARRPSSPRRSRTRATARRRRPAAAAPPSSATAGAARTRRSRARATAASTPTRRWPTRTPTSSAPAEPGRRSHPDLRGVRSARTPLGAAPLR